LAGKGKSITGNKVKLKGIQGWDFALLAVMFQGLKGMEDPLALCGGLGKTALS